MPFGYWRKRGVVIPKQEIKAIRPLGTIDEIIIYQVIPEVQWDASLGSREGCLVAPILNNCGVPLQGEDNPKGYFASVSLKHLQQQELEFWLDTYANIGNRAHCDEKVRSIRTPIDTITPLRFNLRKKIYFVPNVLQAAGYINIVSRG